MFNKFIDDKGKTCQADARNAQLPGATMFHANRKNEQDRVISEKARSLEAWDCFSWFFAWRRWSKQEKIKRTKRLTRKKIKRRRKVSLFLFFAKTIKNKGEKRRQKKANKPKEEPEIDPDDPLIVKLFDVEARVTAWNDQFGADALRKERITRKISNTMRDLIAKTRSAARNSDCRDSMIGFRSGGKKEVKAEAQVLRKIDDITKTYQAIADEYIAGITVSSNY